MQGNILNLNTSYVEVKLSLLVSFKPLIPYLNTSYVEVKLKGKAIAFQTDFRSSELEKIQPFKYILC